MTVVSTVIAALGLLANSAAVVIGAMIIAPLMGPIVGIALATTQGSITIFRAALASELGGVAVCLLTSFVIAVCVPGTQVTAEMLARTAPTTLDLGIALASGVAAAYAIIDERVSASLAGVAVSVALVPPLATCGLLLAIGEYRLSAGSMLLWVTNFVAIQLAAATVFAAFGFGRSSAKNGAVWYFRFLPSSVALLLVGWYLTTTLVRLLAENQRTQIATSVLAREVSLRSGGKLDRVIDIRQSGDGWQVVASALTPRAFEPADVLKMEAELVKAGIPGATLILRSLESKDVDRSGPVYAIAAAEALSREERERAALFDTARNSILDYLKERSGASLVELSGDTSGSPMQFSAVVRTPEPFEPEDVAQAQAALGEALDNAVELAIRSVLTVDSDATTRLYQPIVGPDPYQDLHARLFPVLERRLADLGARLDYLGFSADGKRTVALADAEAVAPLPKEEIASIATDVRKNIDPSIRLKVRTTLAIED